MKPISTKSNLLHYPASISFRYRVTEIWDPSGRSKSTGSLQSSSRTRKLKGATRIDQSDCLLHPFFVQSTSTNFSPQFDSPNFKSHVAYETTFYYCFSSSFIYFLQVFLWFDAWFFFAMIKFHYYKKYCSSCFIIFIYSRVYNPIHESR